MTVDQGIPMFLSKPHFLDADILLTNSIKGLNSRKELHDTYLKIEPNTGAVMNAAQRFQINFMITKTDIWHKNCYEGIMPVVWLENGGQITQDLAKSFKELVYGTQNLSLYLFQGTTALGATLIITGVVFTTKKNRERLYIKSKKKPQELEILKQKEISEINQEVLEGLQKDKE